LAQLPQWLGRGKWDVIHFNWGLHDLKIMADDQRQVPPEAYEKNLRELVLQLKATGANLIWASTTPVPTGKLNPSRNAADVLVYNAIAQKIMDENQVVIDDLYSFALPQLSKIQRPVNVHFTPEGSAALARRVAASIESVLSKKK
jgi:lysophospholipase L1-like esterase